MTANTPVRAATAGELINYRSENQAVKFGLAIHKPATVYTARINQTFTVYDNVTYLDYDGGSGTLADVLPGMTCYIGSAAGLRDKGIARVRRTPTATRLFIGAVSDIAFANDDYLTIVNDFQLWGREVLYSGTTIRMDSAIAYGSRDAECVIRAAPMVAVIQTAPATFTPPSPALSYCYDSATISSWEYSAPGASSTSNMTAGDGTASWTYDTAGVYRWSLSIVDSNGRTQTTHRWVFVAQASPDFVLSSPPVGDFEAGGWSFGVTMYDNASTTDIVDRALVTLYTQAEYFGGALATIGKLAGYENIVATGWIDGESIVRDSQQGTVTFQVMGAAHWMQKVRSTAIALENTSTTPTAWNKVEDMTVDKALARILLWTSTAPLIMDCFFTGSSVLLDLLAQPSGSLYSQIEASAVNTIFAAPVVNSLGQLYISIDPQMMTSAARGNLTTIMTITSADFENPLDLDRLTSGTDALVELQCNVYDGSLLAQVYSRAPGNIGKHYGNYASPGNYYATSQSECNRLAGCLLAIANPSYTPLDVTLAHQNRLIDIAPPQYCEISIAAGDTIRGIALTNQKLIPRRIALQVSDGGYYKTEVTFELATTTTNGVTYFPPPPENQNVDYDYAFGYDKLRFNPGTFPALTTDFPSAVFPPLTPGPCGEGGFNRYALRFDKSEIRGDDEDRVAHLHYPCKLRSSFGFYSHIELDIEYFGDAAGKAVLYGVKDGVRVVTATSSSPYNDFTFELVEEIIVDGFELELEEGLGDIVDYSALDVYASGTINSQDTTRTQVNVPANTLMSLENTDQYWTSVYTPTVLDYLVAAWAENGVDNTGNRVAGYVGRGGDLIYVVLGSQGLYAVGIGTNRARCFFNTQELTSIFLFTSDGLYSDNSYTNTGEVGYIIRYAEADGRRIELGAGVINDICPTVES